MTSLKKWFFAFSFALTLAFVILLSFPVEAFSASEGLLLNNSYLEVIVRMGFFVSTFVFISYFCFSFLTSKKKLLEGVWIEEILWKLTPITLLVFLMAWAVQQNTLLLPGQVDPVVEALEKTDLNFQIADSKTINLSREVQGE